MLRRRLPVVQLLTMLEIAGVVLTATARVIRIMKS